VLKALPGIFPQAALEYPFELAGNIRANLARRLRIRV
jgi:hypothetical protein